MYIVQHQVGPKWFDVVTVKYEDTANRIIAILRCGGKRFHYRIKAK